MGGDFPPIPDWKTYKVGPHTPELEQVQRMLSSMGLKVMRMNYDDSTRYLCHSMTVLQSVNISDRKGSYHQIARH